MRMRQWSIPHIFPNSWFSNILCEQCNLKSEKSFLGERYTYRNRIVCEIWTVSKLSRVCRLLSLYPIAGSENVFRYLDSPWGRVPDADFLRPATNHHQSSSSPTTSTHPQPHIKIKKTALSLFASPARWVLLLLLSK